MSFEQQPRDQSDIIDRKKRKINIRIIVQFDEPIATNIGDHCLFATICLRYDGNNKNKFGMQ